jgi:hypothetical protein
MIAILLLAAAVQTGPIGLGEYRDRLRSIQESIERGNLDEARSGARSLQSARVRHEGIDFIPDGTILEPVADAKDIAAAREAVRPLRALRAELDSARSGPADPAPDGALFERLRQEEELRRASPDGQVGGPSLHAPKVPPSILERISAILEAIGDRIGRFLRWLLNLIFGGGGAGAQAPSTRYLVIGLVVLVLGTLGLVAMMALRRRRASVPMVALSEAPAMSAQDDDPLSRSATEWERFAAELMKSGRYREAIRAWYHAVLVSLFRAGALHYRKDRTNWEYAYALPSGVPWRTGFVEATRTFEREWYGRRDTAVETAESYQDQARRMLTQVREGAAR